jgi:hypothetical protein
VTGVGTIYIQDAQLEAADKATEYIPTTTEAVTRSWDSFSRVQNQVPGICNGTHTHTGAASGGGIAATTLTGTGSGGKFKYQFDTLGKLVLIEATDAGQGYRVDDKLSITTNEGHDIEFRLVEGSNATTVTVGMEATKPSKPVPFPVTKMRVADSTDRRVLIMDQRSRYVFPKPTPYLLDNYEGAAAAYSLRRLRSAYTGPAVRVRRESNNDELDIYFDGQGNLDTASLEAFCAGTNGFVKVWYDQGPGGNDAEQEATGSQPKICDSSTGVILDEDNNLPAALFAGDYLNSGTVSATGTATNFAVGNISGGSTTRALFFTPECFVFFTLTEWRILSSSTQTVYAGNEQGLNLHYFGADNAGDFAAINGGTLTTSANVAAANTKISIGTQATNIVPFYGYVQECIYYNSDQSTNRTGIETNINDYYNIY